MEQNRRLNGADHLPVVHWLCFVPSLAEITRPFEMNAPAIVFGAAWTKNVFVRQLDWLVLYRAQNSLRQPSWLRNLTCECGPQVIQFHHHPPPLAWARANFVEQ